MKRAGAQKCQFLLLTTLLLFACHNDDHIDESPHLVVSEVYNHDAKLIAQYEYDDKGRLSTRKCMETDNNVSSVLVVKYNGDIISTVEYIDYQFPDFNYTRAFVYASNKKLAGVETVKAGKVISYWSFIYDINKHIVSVGLNNNPPGVFFKYDNNSNIVRTTHILKDPLQGEIRQVIDIKYDTGRKAPFGVPQFTPIEFLPALGDHLWWEKSFSENNILKDNASGTEYSYTYNAEGYPDKITMTWTSSETEKPMEFNIRYKTLK